MNCLFIIRYEPIANAGGIEAVTGILSQEFQKINIKTYCLWKNASISNSDKFQFIGSRCISNLNSAGIAELLKQWEIDIIIIQSFNDNLKEIKKAVNRSNREVKILYALHSIPGWELQYTSWNYIRNATDRNKAKKWLKCLLYPVYRPYHIMKNYYTYRMIYSISHKLIVLSPQFINSFCTKYRIKDNFKIISIPNPCRFISNTSLHATFDKEKSVLIVSRLTEHPKNLITALSIWKAIEEDEQFKDWNLTIVGDGPDKNLYLNYIKSTSLKRVKLVGQQDPTDFYKQSSIFLMTSKYEGFGLTLVESQYFGCIPIAFNTFESIIDIVQTGTNGILIDKNDEIKYVEELKHLMSNYDLRCTLAINATIDSMKFSPSIIAKRWSNLFDLVLNRANNSIQQKL